MAVKPCFTSYTTAQGLADNTVTEVLQLPDGKMAIGSNQGITLFDPPQGPAEDFTTLSGIEHYNESRKNRGAVDFSISKMV